MRPASWAAVGGAHLPVNPCGRAMDWLQVCYETDARFPGFGVHRIRYYFTDLPFLALPSVYGSKNWWRENEAELLWDDGSPGEIWTSLHRRTNGKPPADCVCTEPQGSPAAWLGESDASFPTFEPCRWGAAYDHAYSADYDSLTLVES